MDKPTIGEQRKRMLAHYEKASHLVNNWYATIPLAIRLWYDLREADIEDPIKLIHEYQNMKKVVVDGIRAIHEKNREAGKGHHSIRMICENTLEKINMPIEPENKKDKVTPQGENQ